ncbi:DUF5984 family protein [Streptomyces niveus]|uniref:DUF5984 family protein n=1 Tax=Streptomyces niveus TaxID=193462 RepID=A0ABZ1ZWP4_STRNV|nr:DUF5984 family protein [Streptomyces niveus]WTA63114.1 DUF5984 family protein [Streptomyces niveus]
MIRFRFGLTPVHDIQPWGGDTPSLSWFSLTDGWYDIEVDDRHLFRHAAGGTSVDYYVVRLWEDVLDVLPQALEPVPADLVPFVAGDHTQWLPADRPDTEAAAAWYGQHALDTGYLRTAPHIRWWRTTAASGDDLMTVTWTPDPDSDSDTDHDGAAGRVTLPTPDFVAAVTALHHDLLAAMEERVTALEATGPPPGVHIDLPHLRHEQRDRAAWLGRALERACDTDWAAVRAGARLLVPPPPP